MSEYVVVHPFADAKDNGRVYRTGDAYPRDGLEPDALRIAELASTANALGFPLIAKLDSSKPKTAEKPARAKGTKSKG